MERAGHLKQQGLIEVDGGNADCAGQAEKRQGRMGGNRCLAGRDWFGGHANRGLTTSVNGGKRMGAREKSITLKQGEK